MPLFPAWCAEAWVGYQTLRNLGFDMVHQGGPPYLALARGLIAKGFKLEAFDEKATAALKALGPL